MRRLHLNGEFPPLRHYANWPVAFFQAVLRKVFGVYPRRPWIPFAAARRLETLLNKDSRVWEVGSGNSTLWLSDRVGHVVSIEADKDWFDKLSGMLASEHATHVELRHLWRENEMASFADAQDLDLLFIDGGPRGRCLLAGVSKVKPGGYIYCDNVEVGAYWSGSFEAMLRELDGRIETVEFFLDYAPAQAFLNRGALLRTTSESR